MSQYSRASSRQDQLRMRLQHLRGRGTAPLPGSFDTVSAPAHDVHDAKKALQMGAGFHTVQDTLEPKPAGKPDVSALAQELLLANHAGDERGVADVMSRLQAIASSSESISTAQARATVSDDDWNEAAAPLLKMTRAEHASMKQATARMSAMRVADPGKLAQMRDDHAARRKLATQFPELAGTLMGGGDARALGSMMRRQQLRHRRVAHDGRLAEVDALDCDESAVAQGRKVLGANASGEILTSRPTPQEDDGDIARYMEAMGM